MKMYALFSELPVTTEYSRNGDALRKQSSRTQFFQRYSVWHYARQSDLCIVAPYSRLAADYFRGVK